MRRAKIRSYISILVLTLVCLLCIAPENTSAAWVKNLVIDLEDADWTLVGEEAGDWTGYFASPAGDVNGDGLGDILVGAPMAGEKVCPYPLNPDGSCPALPKGQGVAYLVLGREGSLEPNPLNLEQADASFLGCEINTMTARQLYTAGDVNGDGYDDILVSGWKCGENFTGKAYLFLGRPDVESWGRFFPVEQADASFLGENEYDFLSYYTSTAGDVNGDGNDDFLITSTHHEYDEVCLPDQPEGCNNCCKNLNNSAEIYNITEDTWTITTNPLSVERMNHTALLTGDKVLIAGGQNTSDYLASTEEFDPATGFWALKGDLVVSRASHTTTLLANGMVLAAGGVNLDGALSSTELFNPAAGEWEVTGALNNPRSHHTASLLPDGKVLIAGGTDVIGPLASVEIFNPDSGLWTPTDNMNESRTGHTATPLTNGKILVVGGQNTTGYTASAELFDPVAEEWLTTGGLNVARSNHSATMLPDGKVMVAGGQDSSGFLSDAEIYDPAAGTWSVTESMREGRIDHTATLLADGRVLVAGGQNLGGSENGYEIYDPDESGWSSEVLLTLNFGRANHIAVVLPDNTVLVAGGRHCTDFGKVYLVLGRQEADWGTDFDVSQVDATFLGEAVGDRIGRSTAGVGDVNGDGYDDFLIGSISSDYAGSNAGQNYLFLGRASPADPDYDPSRPWWDLDTSIAEADASFVGENVGDESGRRVAWAGDVDGDGLDDMLMQAALNDYSGSNAGISYLVLGRSSADWGLRYSLANADASFVGEMNFDQSGRRLSGAGDVNNDGYDDIIIGAPHNQEASEFPNIIAGKAYMIFGRPEVDWGNYFPLAQADIIYRGKPEIGVAGYDIGWLDDFNGDGIDDFLIAAYGGRNNTHTPGEVYIQLGSETPVPVQFLPELLELQDKLIVRYVGEFWEPNGWENIRTVEIVLDTESTDRVVLKIKYDRIDNKLFLSNAQGDLWLDPCTPGVGPVLENGMVRMECKVILANDNNHALRAGGNIRWLQRDKAEREFKVYLRVIDQEGNDSGLKNFGTWTLFSDHIYLPIIIR